MASKAKKDTSSASNNSFGKPKIKRKGRNSKKRTSSIKTSKNYVKAYSGQGRG